MIWSDLYTRVISAVVMAAVALAGFWCGGIYFNALVAFVAAMMIWEMAQITGQDNPRITVALPVLVALGLLLFQPNTDVGMGGSALVILGFTFAFGVGSHRLFALAAVIIMIACSFVVALYSAMPTLLLFLIAVVIASDVAGYFVGRAVGGPKFWPSLSPKKTWSGTLGGWVLAAVVGLLFWVFAGIGWGIIPIAVIMAFAAQMGDIAESALKRRMQVKDSSDLIPGHGGFADRFDGFVGATLALWLIYTSGLYSAI